MIFNDIVKSGTPNLVGEGLLACAEGGTEVAEHLHRVRHPQAYRELAIYSYRG